MKIHLNAFNSFWRKIFKFILILTIIVSHIYFWDLIGNKYLGELNTDADIFFYNVIGCVAELIALVCFIGINEHIYIPLKKEYIKNYK